MKQGWGKLGIRFVLAIAVVAVALEGCASMSARAQEQTRTLLITGFEPFGGRARNNSFEVAKKIQSDTGRLGEHVRVEICELPVIYDQAAKVAKACFERMNPRPDWVVSLGEGGCDVRLETAATNLDDSPVPDNSGAVRVNHPIESSFSSRIGFTLPVDRSYCERPESPTPVVASISPGNYVCNNTAFLLAHYFKDHNVPYGFIHLPPEECGHGWHHENKLVKLVTDLLRPALASLPVEPWPTDLLSTRELIQRLTSPEPPACDLQFAQRLEALYQGGLPIQAQLR